MFVYDVNRVDHCDYDEYDGFVVIAKDENRALEMANNIQDGQYTIEKIGISVYGEERMILESFRAG